MNEWQNPKNEAELKDFVQHRMAPRKLEMMGIDIGNFDATLISERDHKLFKVRYGISVPYRSETPLVFEQEGLAGQRQVAFNNGRIEEIDDAQYQRLWGEKAAVPAPTGPPASDKSADAAAKQSDKK